MRRKTAIVCVLLACPCEQLSLPRHAGRGVNTDVPDQDSIGGNAPHCCDRLPEPGGGLCAREPVHVGRFAQRASQIVNAPIVNEEQRGDAGLLARRE